MTMPKGRALIATVIALLGLAGCGGNPVIYEKDVQNWPLTVREAKIICEEGRPVQAIILGKPYALIGREKAKLEAQGVDIPFLNHDQAALFKPNPEPSLAAAGFKAYLDGFRTAAEKACK